MSYFGEPIDILDYMSHEVGATASLHDGEVKAAMVWLGERLAELSPLYQALSIYCDDKDTDSTEVIDEFKKLLQEKK